MKQKKAKVLSAYEFMSKFASKRKAVKFFEKTRWPNGIICRHCQSKRISEVKNRLGSYQCKDCRKTFTIKTGSVFEDSKIELKKWLYAVYLLQTARKGISSLQLSKQLGIRQAAAWFMLHRLREACKSKGGLLSGDVQVDETWFGGLSKNKHKSKLKKRNKLEGSKGYGSRNEIRK